MGNTKHSFYTQVDGKPVHIQATGKLSKETQAALVVLVRAAVKKLSAKEVSRG